MTHTPEPMDNDEKEPMIPNTSARFKTGARSSAADRLKTTKRIAVIIDYRTIEMEARHECKCGAILSDAQIMVGWCSEFKAVSKTFPCLMCRSNSFAPKLHVRYQITRLSAESSISAFDVVDQFIEYISPLQLRTKVNRILTLNRLDFEDPELFRVQHEEEFWNMLWYFHHRQLDLSFLLGEQDAASLCIAPFGTGRRRRQISGRKLLGLDDDNEHKGGDRHYLEQSPSPETTPDPPTLDPPLLVLEPQSDLELLSRLKPIYTMATTGKMKKAVSMWLTNRKQTAVCLRFVNHIDTAFF